jgi:hypothetical protein
MGRWGLVGGRRSLDMCPGKARLLLFVSLLLGCHEVNTSVTNSHHHDVQTHYKSRNMEPRLNP